MFNEKLFQTKNNVINTPQYFVSECMEYALLYLGLQLILIVVFTFNPTPSMLSPQTRLFTVYSRCRQLADWGNLRQKRKRTETMQDHVVPLKCPLWGTDSAHLANSSCLLLRCRRQCLSCPLRSPCCTCPQAPCHSWGCRPRIVRLAIHLRGQRSGHCPWRSTFQSSSAVPMRQLRWFSHSDGRMPGYQRRSFSLTSHMKFYKLLLFSHTLKTAC